jgi:hypothetical protein
MYHDKATSSVGATYMPTGGSYEAFLNEWRPILQTRCS